MAQTRHTPTLETDNAFTGANTFTKLNTQHWVSATVSLQTAITAACVDGGTVVIPANFTAAPSTVSGVGEWSMAPICNGLTIEGEVPTTSIIQVPCGTMSSGTDYPDLFYYLNGTTPLSNVTFRNFTVDMQGGCNPEPAAHPDKRFAFVRVPYVQDLVVENVAVNNNPGRQSISVGSDTYPQTATRVKIRKNTFHNGGIGVSGNTNQNDHSAVYLQATESELTDNYAYNDSMVANGTAYEIHAKNSTITRNRAKNWAQGMNLVATVTDFQSNDVGFNILENVLTGFDLWDFATSAGSCGGSDCKFDDANIHDNTVTLSDTSNTGCIYGNNSTLQVAITNVDIHGNHCSQTIDGSSVNKIAAGVSLTKCSGVRITGEEIWNMSGRGIDLTCGDNSIISNNQIHDVGQGGNVAGYTQGITIQTAGTINGPMVMGNRVFNQTTSATTIGLQLFGAINNPVISGNYWNVATEVVATSRTGTGMFHCSPKFSFCTNSEDATYTPLWFGGKSADQVVGLDLGDKSGTRLYSFRKNANGSVSIYDYTASLAVFNATTGTTTSVNAGGSAPVTVNSAANSGTGGFQVWSGSASPASVFTVSNTGVAAAAGGIKAGASGSTITDTRNIVQAVVGSTGTVQLSSHMVIGSATLASGTPSTVTVTLSAAAVYTSNSSYKCSLTNETTQANQVKITYTDGSHFTITGPNTVTDSISYVCNGN